MHVATIPRRRGGEQVLKRAILAEVDLADLVPLAIDVPDDLPR